MRTFEEIIAEAKQATATSDADGLLRLADELDALDTTKATVSALRSRGLAGFIKGHNSAPLEYFQKSLELSEEDSHSEGTAWTHRNLGRIYHRIGEYKRALVHSKKALLLFTELDNRLGVASSMFVIGNICFSTGNYSDAIEQYNGALNLYIQLGELSGQGNIYNAIGNVHDTIADYPVALDHYQKALDLFKEQGSRGGIAIVTGNIATVYFHTRDYEASLRHYGKARELHSALADQSGEASCIGNIGAVLYKTGDYSAALEHYQKALDLHQQLGELPIAALVASNMVECLLEMNRLDEALALLEKRENTTTVAPGIRSSHLIYRAIYLEKTSDYEGAHEKFVQALDSVKTAGLRAEEAEVHEHLRDLSQKRNDFAGYVEHNNEFTRITEETNGKDTATRLAMQAKQREIDAERKEHEKQLAVLHSTLPKHIADRVARGETVNDHHENASVIFIDIVGFTTKSSSMNSGKVTTLLAELFERFDTICDEHNITKIKTIGDSYMAAGFEAATDAASAALAMRATQLSWPDGSPLQFRIGVHCGPVTAGVIGTKRMQYDVWGDTVNVASRMESSGEAGKVQASEKFVALLRGNVGSPSLRSGDDNDDSVAVVERGSIDIKGKGSMKTFWLEGA